MRTVAIVVSFEEGHRSLARHIDGTARFGLFANEAAAAAGWPPVRRRHVLLLLLLMLLGDRRCAGGQTVSHALTAYWLVARISFWLCIA